MTPNQLQSSVRPASGQAAAAPLTGRVDPPQLAGRGGRCFPAGSQSRSRDLSCVVIPWRRRPGRPDAPRSTAAAAAAAVTRADRSCRRPASGAGPAVLPSMERVRKLVAPREIDAAGD